MATTKNIKYGSGKPTSEAAGKPIGNLAYTPMSEKEKDAHMKKGVEDLHKTNYQTSGFGGSSSKFGPVKLK